MNPHRASSGCPVAGPLCVANQPLSAAKTPYAVVVCKPYSGGVRQRTKRGRSHARSGGSMKFGLRIPSLKKRIAARLSWKRYVRHSLGFKAPRGWGWLTSPKKAAYNRIYNRTTVGCGLVFVISTAAAATVLTLLLWH